jgi:hypothetical protein
MVLHGQLLLHLPVSATLRKSQHGAQAAAAMLESQLQISLKTYYGFLGRPAAAVRGRRVPSVRWHTLLPSGTCAPLEALRQLDQT